MTSLQEYVQHREQQAPRCTTCKLPAELLTQVNDARKGDTPITYKLISAWLEEEHSETISVPTLQNHFKFNHHQRKEARA